MRPNPVRLLPLTAVMAAWELSHTQIYRRLTPLEHPGVKRAYYSEAEAREKLGEPLHSIEVRRGSPKPPYLSRQEIGQTVRGLRLRRRIGAAVSRKARPAQVPAAQTSRELRAKVAS